MLLDPQADPGHAAVRNRESLVQVQMSKSAPNSGAGRDTIA